MSYISSDQLKKGRKLGKIFSGCSVVALGLLMMEFSAYKDIFTTTFAGMIVTIAGYLISQDGVNGNKRIHLDKLKNISEHILLRDTMLAFAGASLFAFGVGVLFDGLRSGYLLDGIISTATIGLGYATCHYAIDDLPW